MAIPKSLLTAIVSHLAVTSRKVIWGPELCYCTYLDMLCSWSSRTLSTGAVLQLLPLLHKHKIAPSSAQSIHNKEEQIHRCLAPELLSFAVQHSHCSSSLAEQYGWLPKSEPLAARRQSSLLQCLSCVQKMTDIYYREQRKLLMTSKTWFLQLRWLAGKSTNINTNTRTKPGCLPEFNSQCHK